MDTITFAVDYWGKGLIEALFLRHEGFIGVLLCCGFGCVEH